MHKKQKTLIIKTGYSEFLDKKNNSREVSLGDVLRITPLLHLYKEDDVTWIADKYVFPLLEKNHFIKNLVHLDWIAAEQLKSEEFDNVINLEKIPGICALSDKIRARKSRYGFTFNSQTGGVEVYERAFDVLTVCLDTKVKRENKKFHQELLFEAVGKKWHGEEYVLGYKPKSRKSYDICLNTTVGRKWPTKEWPPEKWDKLERILIDSGFNVTRQDKQKNVLLNLYDYIKWVNSCKLIISGDTLGMHLGIALKKKVLGLFGPTPYKEVCFYDRGEAILPDGSFECLSCYKAKCNKDRFCMENISPEKVYKKAIKWLK